MEVLRILLRIRNKNRIGIFFTLTQLLCENN
jgi:hypothetical protein